jgi:hypothetical protein
VIFLLQGKPQNPENVTPLGEYPQNKRHHLRLSLMLLRPDTSNPHSLKH